MFSIFFKKRFTLFIFAIIFLFTFGEGAFSFSPPPEEPEEPVIEGCIGENALDTIPDLQMPSLESWKHSSTGWFIVSQGSPYHMVHDAIIAEGSSAVITGKFDYGSVFHKDLEDEKVHAYIYGTGMNSWQYLGAHWTNGDGKINVTVSDRPAGNYMIKMVVAGDLSQAYGFMTVIQPGEKFAVFDIDGTLTTSDFEVIKDYTNVADASDYFYAKELVELYRVMGYRILYITARPYWVTKDTRQWFNNKGFPDTLLRVTNNNTDTISSSETEMYKTDALLDIIGAGGTIFRAYGNADTDIGAYENAGIPKSSTFIIGDNAGNEGTMPLYGDYEDHYFDVKDTLQCGL